MDASVAAWMVNSGRATYCGQRNKGRLEILKRIDFFDLARAGKRHTTASYFEQKNTLPEQSSVN